MGETLSGYDVDEKGGNIECAKGISTNLMENDVAIVETKTKWATGVISMGLLTAMSLAGCSAPSETNKAEVAETAMTLAEAREGKGAGLVEELKQTAPAPSPPGNMLKLVRYPSNGREITGYLTVKPADGQKHPAMIWISGGDLAIGDFWSPQPADNDQSASIFREKGLVVFYPSMRGLNGNGGSIEGFYGELDDIVAATEWLKQQPNVDPSRIYLGGHSTGGTMVLLASEYADEWAGVFSFGPVTDPTMYGDVAPVPISPSDKEGARLRAPINWLASIKKPTFVVEGNGRGNIDELEALRSVNNNPQVRFIAGGGCDHFSVLRPASTIIADAIVQNTVNDLSTNEAFRELCSN